LSGGCVTEMTVKQGSILFWKTQQQVFTDQFVICCAFLEGFSPTQDKLTGDE